VVLWATWCRTCFELFPALDVLAGSAEGQGLSIHAISVDEDLEKVKEAGGRIPQRVLVLWDKGAERLGERLGIEELPTIIVLDRRGIVRFVHEGSDERLVGQVDAEIRRLLRD
jgi:thiol-disulfide isomerase/thioredoxin